jgi:hypothetical protein
MTTRQHGLLFGLGRPAVLGIRVGIDFRVEPERTEDRFFFAVEIQR